MFGKTLTGSLLLALVLMPAPAQAGPIEDVVDTVFAPTDCVFDSECNPCGGGGCSPCQGGGCDPCDNGGSGCGTVDYYTRDEKPKNNIPDWIERAAFDCSASGGAHTFTVQFTAVCTVTTGSSAATAQPIIIIGPCEGNDPETYCAVRGISKAVARYGDDALNGTSLQEIYDNTGELPGTVEECLDNAQNNPACPQLLQR